VGLNRFDDNCQGCPPEDWPDDIPPDCSEYVCAGLSRTEKVVALAWITGAAFATLGHFIGKAIKTDNWQPIQLNQIRLGFAGEQPKLIIQVSLTL
jgi:hypothetical protein